MWDEKRVTYTYGKAVPQAIDKVGSVEHAVSGRIAKKAGQWYLPSHESSSSSLGVEYYHRHQYRKLSHSRANR